MVPLAAAQVSRPIHIGGVYNARAIGSGPWLVRAAAVDGLTDAGVDTLAELGVRLILDLREDGEALSRGAHGLGIRRIPLYRLPDGPPQTGALEDVYDLLLGSRGAELASAVAALAEAPGPVLVHCTAGKDRTGLVVALALSAAGWPREAVVADYILSAPEVRSRRHDTVQALLGALDLDDHARREALRLHLDSPPEAIGHALDRLERADGAAGYLLRHGLTAAQLDRLRTKVRA